MIRQEVEYHGLNEEVGVVEVTYEVEPQIYDNDGDGLEIIEVITEEGLDVFDDLTMIELHNIEEAAATHYYDR